MPKLRSTGLKEAAMIRCTCLWRTAGNTRFHFREKPGKYSKDTDALARIRHHDGAIKSTV
jgi:hypothetical protein